MKHIFTALVLILVSFSTMSSQTTGGKIDRDSTTEHELKMLDREWCEAIVRYDAAALDRLLADDYILITHSGDILTKAQEIAEAKELTLGFTFRSFTAEDVDVRLVGEQATMTGQSVLKALFDGEEITAR